jgi:hypothetical protein
MNDNPQATDTHHHPSEVDVYLRTNSKFIASVNDENNDVSFQNKNSKQCHIKKKKHSSKSCTKDQCQCRDRYLFYRDRQVRILAFFFAVLIALLSLFGLLFLRYYAITNATIVMKKQVSSEKKS